MPERDVLRLTMDEANEWMQDLNDRPPTHELVAAYLGLKPKQKPRPPTPEEISSIFGG